MHGRMIHGDPQLLPLVRFLIVKILLSAGADPNQQDVDGWSPLCYARSIEVAEALLAAGADPSLANDFGATAASVVREPDVRRFLRGQ
jgi:ankyrin repeat protein